MSGPKKCDRCSAMKELNYCTNCGDEVCNDCWYGYSEDADGELCYSCLEDIDNK